MTPLISQIAAVVKMTVAGLPSRFWGSFTTIVSIALVVATLLAFLAMATGFAKTVAGTGQDDIAVVLGSGSATELNSGLSSEAVRLLQEAPGIRRGADGKPIVSPEVYVVVDAMRKVGGSPSNISLRGVTSGAMSMRQGFTVTQGRMFEPGTNELIVGAGVLREFTGFELNREMTFGASKFKVVGVFEVPGTVFDSELWADLPVVQTLFNRGNSVQSMRARLERPNDLTGIETLVKNDPRLRVDVVTERDYFATEAQALVTLIVFGWALAITLALGALAGALNTMYAAVEARTKELATLRAIGFGGVPAFFGAMTESIVLAAGGGLLGGVAAFLLFNGISASTLGGNFTQVVFKFSLGPEQFLYGFVLALILGLVGGFFPALRAARTPILKIGAE
jgi:putative ABC transport system permease protein